MNAGTLIELYNSAAVNRISEFAVVASDLGVPQLARLYSKLVGAAPRRHERGKCYLSGRIGITSSGTYSNRNEEHLAVALFNASRGGATFDLPDLRQLVFIDYQTPLKARRTDAGVGKIDLFGVIDDQIPCVVELKVGGGDTPLRALLEGLAYCALVEANIADIALEATALHGLTLLPVRPALIVIAPDDYWMKYLANKRAGQWFPAIRDLSSRIRETLELEVHLLALLDAAFEMGLGGRPSRLTGDCRVVSVEQLAASDGRARS